MNPIIENPEATLVGRLARGDLERAAECIRGGLDWTRVADLADQHQVAGLCWHFAKGSNGKHPAVVDIELPRWVIQRFRATNRAHTLRNMLLLDELVRLQDELHDRKIDALYLKGPWLAWEAYPEIGARPIGDIDLRIREVDYHNALAALEAAGYRPEAPLPRTGAKAVKHSLYRHQLCFQGRQGFRLELHFRMVNLGPPGDGEAWIWRAARNVRIGPCTLKVPGPEAMLLHLLIHANQHGFGKLRFLHDIRWALERDGSNLDMLSLTKAISALRLGASAYFGLVLARELAGATPASELVAGLRPSVMRRAVFQSVWGLSSVRRYEMRSVNRRFESPRLYLLEMGGLKDKLRYLGGIVVHLARSLDRQRLPWTTRE